MRWLRARLLTGGGRTSRRAARLERFHALYEAIDTFLYTPAVGDATARPTCATRIDLKRMMMHRSSSPRCRAC